MHLERVKESAKIFCSDIEENGIDRLQRGYLTSYYYFLGYFDALEEFESKDVVIGAGFTYSWMDKILSWRIDSPAALTKAADVMNKASALTSIDQVSSLDIKPLKEVVAGSYVGTSKLLHFVNPSVFPIYDSHICRYFYGAIKDHNVNTKKRFYGYVNIIKELVADPAFCESVYQPIAEALCKQGFDPVSELRGVEMAVFHHQRKISANKAN
jgi:hypothetical protein